jgi:hypothetical protein
MLKSVKKMQLLCFDERQSSHRAPYIYFVNTNTTANITISLLLPKELTLKQLTLSNLRKHTYSLPVLWMQHIETHVWYLYLTWNVPENVNGSG